MSQIESIRAALPAKRHFQANKTNTTGILHHLPPQSFSECLPRLPSLWSNLSKLIVANYLVARSSVKRWCKSASRFTKKSINFNTYLNWYDYAYHSQLNYLTISIIGFVISLFQVLFFVPGNGQDSTMSMASNLDSLLANASFKPLFIFQLQTIRPP